MKKLKKLWMIALLSIVAQSSIAAVVGERLTKDGFIYTVLTTGSNPTLSVIGCTKSGSVTIPGTVTIGDEVFTITQISGTANKAEWGGISNISLPNTLTTIGSYALFGAKALKTIEIPASVTTIKSNPFGISATSIGLESVTVAAGNTHFESVDGTLYTAGRQELVYVPLKKTFEDNTFTVDGNTTTIRTGSFTGNETVTKAIIPPSVTVIQQAWAPFGYACKNLEVFEVDGGNNTYCSLDGVIYTNDMETLCLYPIGKKDKLFMVPEEVKKISSFAFNANIKLQEIDLGNVETLEPTAFQSMSNLKTIVIPPTLTSLEGAFNLCNNIEKYIVKDGNPVYASMNDDGVIYSTDKTTIIAVPPTMTEYTIPESVTTISQRAFAGSNIEKITIPGHVSTIETQAFRGASFSEIEFKEPSSLTSINNTVFYGTNNLTTITLPKSVKSIGYQSFYDCKNLKTIIIPDGSELESFGRSAFKDCPIEEIIFEGSCNLQTISTSTFQGMEKLKSITLPSSVVTISANAFLGCTSLEEVNFAEDAAIMTIGTGAFAGCSALKSFEVPEKVKSIGYEAFRGCTALTSVSLSAVTKDIAPGAFKGCVNLATFEVDPANPYYSTVKNMLCDKEKKTLVLFPAGLASDDITLLPPSLTAIGDYAFYMCDPLTNVIIPKNVTSIGKRAFGLCENLESVAFLCDGMFPVEGINQTLNEQSFDDGQTPGIDDKRPNITLYVREDALADYQAEPYYQAFHDGAAGIRTSFTVKHEGSEAAEETDDFFPLSNKAMALLGTKAKVYTYVVPKKVVSPVDGLERSVNMIGDYAFDGADVTEVVMLDNIRMLGAKAFWTDQNNAKASKIENIFFIGNDAVNYLSSIDFELPAGYEEFQPAQKIYVKKSRLDAYKAALSTFQDQIDYKIPFEVKGTYATFSREFDTDFSEDNASQTEEDMPNVIAFTAGKYMEATGQDGLLRFVRMHSINEGAAQGDGTYIPAYTGVVLKAVDGKSKDNFFYQIHEDELAKYTAENLMQEVTVNPRLVQPTEGSNRNLIVSGGQLYKMTQPREIPVHKAYMQLPESELPTGAKAVMLFFYGEEELPGTLEETDAADVADGIHAVTAEAGDQTWYTLQGTRVSKPAKGVYIRNGRKVVVK